MPEPRIVVAVVWSSVVAVAASGCAADASWPRADGSGEASLSSVIASDAFTRIGAEGWGAADLGGTWSTFQGAPSDYWVDGSLGDIRVRTAGVDQGCWLPDTSASDVQVSLAVQTSVLATAGDLSAAAVFRDGPGLGNLYAGRLIFGADHTLEVTLEEKVGADWLVLGGPVAVPGEHVTSQRYRVRARATGSTLRMKAWREGTPEPGAWQLELEDSTFATGAVGVTVRSDAASDPPPIFGVDDFAASARP